MRQGVKREGDPGWEERVEGRTVVGEIGVRGGPQPWETHWRPKCTH